MDRISDIDFASLRAGKEFFPSPLAWEDQVLYFLLLDRFSDGREGVATRAYDPRADYGNAIATEEQAAAWRDAGGKWCGGNLKGLASKIGYLEGLGITAIWVSPIFKQVRFCDTYHGYGIQDFLAVDPHFGTLEDLRAMVKTAHDHGLYVILDIILNHAGNIFSYAVENGQPPWRGQGYPVLGFNDKEGRASIPFADYSSGDARSPAGKDDAVWPLELQSPESFSRKGRITDWENELEFREGDFFDLKDIDQGYGSDDYYIPSRALLAVTEAYKYWVAAADIDGYRIDTVKHMDIGATRYFARSIKEFAQVLGKENFFLVGEITGGRERATHTLETTGLDAALGIDDVQLRLAGLVKGSVDPAEYFELFRHSLQVGKESHTWFRNKVVTMVDDHDQVCKGEHKARFCADGDGEALALAALALNATTLGIPCVYYGSEQLFDGRGDGDGADRYIREAMFGGSFGAFRSKDRHFFDADGEVYRELAAVLELRSKRLALRRGRQYLRDISGDGLHFGPPRALGGRILSLVAWSRILDVSEILLAINTDPSQPRKAWVVVDSGLHPAGSALKLVYSTRHADEGMLFPVHGKGENALVAALELEVPPAGFVALE